MKSRKCGNIARNYKSAYLNDMVLYMCYCYLYENPPFTMLAATKSKSASSRTMQASFPPSSIWRGTIADFFDIAIPVSPPVKLRKD